MSNFKNKMLRILRLENKRRIDRNMTPLDYLYITVLSDKYEDFEKFRNKNNHNKIRYIFVMNNIKIMGRFGFVIPFISLDDKWKTKIIGTNSDFKFNGFEIQNLMVDYYKNNIFYKEIRDY